MEASMNRIARLVAVVAGFALTLNVTPSWGQPVCAAPGCNPTQSDTHRNTAGGNFALSIVDQTPAGGFDNTAFGFQALLNDTIGDANTAFGTFALRSNTTGTTNTASGINALLNNTTGIDNTATGGGSLLGNSTGSKNTAIGVAALNQSAGNKNIGIGFKAGLTLTTGNNNIFIGNQGAGAESQTIRIGTAQTQTFIAGIGTTPVSGAIVMVDSGTGQLGSGPPSSARYKQDIETMGHRSAGVLQLRPVTFAYRGDAAGTTHYGLVAEEVATLYPELVVRAATGEVQTVKYLELIPMLLNELQRQRQEFQQALQGQQQALQRQQHELAELRALVGQGRELAASSR
jgi:hypothetical protein